MVKTKKHLFRSQIGNGIESEDTGGTIGRLVEFDLVTGRLDVNTKM